MSNKDKDKDNELIATCNQCGFSVYPDKFEPALSIYHDLRCPKCGKTDIDYTNGSYKDNFLVLEEEKESDKK